MRGRKLAFCKAQPDWDVDVFRMLCPVSGGGCDVSDQMAFYEGYLYISVHCVSGSG